MTENIVKDTNKPSKLRIAFVAVILGGPFVYLGLIVIVLYKPEIMTWVGLEPFVAYLIELQPAGYENLVRLNSPAFANYFFHFHAASLLAVGGINFLFIILMAPLLNSFPKFDKDFFESVRSPYLPFPTDFTIKYFEILIWFSAVFVFCIGWFWISAPAQMGISNRFPPNNHGIGLSILLWPMFSFLFQGATLGISSRFLHSYWPKIRSWLVNKQKLDQKIKHSAKQLTKR